MQDKDGSVKAQQGRSEQPHDARDNPIETPNVVDPVIERPPTPPPYDGPKGGNDSSGQS